jgi:serine protease inhibitor
MRRMIILLAAAALWLPAAGGACAAPAETTEPGEAAKPTQAEPPQAEQQPQQPGQPHETQPAQAEQPQPVEQRPQAEQPHEAQPAQAATDAASLAKAQGRLGFSLIDKISGPAQGQAKGPAKGQAKGETSKGEGNYIVSPASLAAALALIDLGANREMRAALAKTLVLEGGADKLAALRERVKALSAERGGPLTTANAILIDPAAQPYPTVVDKLNASGAEVTVENLSDPAILKRINDWVKERTAGLIPSILDQAPREGGLVALNALHFKDRWRSPFDPALTRPVPFQIIGAAPAEVPMMQLTDARLRFRRQGSFVAVELPYATERFQLVVITTTDKPARPAEFRPVADWLTGEGFKESQGELSLPRFTLGSSVDLLQALDALGLAAARRSPRALSELSPVPMTITQVLQRTEIKVDEAGTEAAAASAVVTSRGVALDYVKMMVDKPFLFALRDADTGLVLLTGYVGNAKALAS